MARILQSIDRGALWAALLSFVPLATLAHGLFGTGSIVSGLLFAAPIVILLACGTRFVFDTTDTLFILLALIIAASIAIHPIVDGKETAILLLSLACYPACRIAGYPVLTKLFFTTLGLIILAGTAATAMALIQQWNDRHGKPLVFGEFDAAPTELTVIMGYAVLGLASLRLTSKQVLYASFAIIIPTAVFAASMVRFSFAALAVSLALVILIGGSRNRISASMLLVFLAASVTVGLVARSHTAVEFAQTATRTMEAPSTYEVPAIAHEVAGSSCADVNQYNSISIRKKLYEEALKLLPSSGLLGSGLDSFMSMTCLKGHEVHNSILQIAIEFGPIAAVLLVALILIPLSNLLALSRIDEEATFCLSGLFFTVLICLAHGRISRDFHLFMFLGYATAMRASHSAIAKEWMLRGFAGVDGS